MLLKKIENIKRNNKVENYNLLIETCIKIGLGRISHLTYSINKATKCYINQRDVVIDAITPLFIESSEGLLGLQRSINNWQYPLETETDAEYFLYIIVSKRLEQHIISLLKEADPFYTYIHRTINYYSKKLGFKKATYRNTKYLVKEQMQLISVLLIPPEELRYLPANLFMHKPEKILNDLHTYLIENTVYFPAIPVNALIKQIKILTTPKYLGNEYFNNEIILSENLFIDTIINRSLSECYDRIDKFYIAKGKIAPSEAEQFKNALKDIANDLKDGDLHQSLYGYMREQMTSLSKEKFYTQYHPILDHLTRVLKNFIGKQLVSH
jgi:hypothetical protein